MGVLDEIMGAPIYMRARVVQARRRDVVDHGGAAQVVKLNTSL